MNALRRKTNVRFAGLDWMRFRNKAYLVTGGSGFIGSHLVAALQSQGHRVRVLDNRFPGRGHHVADEVEAVTGDVADPEAVDEALVGIDGCFHVAAIASVARCQEDWVGAHRTNLTGTIVVMDRARRRSEGRLLPVVYASSAAVYGEQPAVPQDEHAVCRPLTAYGADKLAGEWHARIAAATYGLPNAPLRLFNVYGPGQDPFSPYSGVISVFASRALAGRPLYVHGDGLQVRDFVYVGDAVEALMRAMARLEERGEACAPLNVCSGRPVTVRQLAGAVAEAVGVPNRIEYGPPRAGDIRNSLGSPDRARRVLGWTAATPLDEGVARTVAAMAKSEERPAVDRTQGLGEPCAAS